jgi:GT2 family glycosyltransferase/SAM-dependent methyltransferase
MSPTYEDHRSKRYEPPVIDLENKNSSHALLIELTGRNKDVLEVGTSTGYISRILKERGNTVTGIEIDPEAGEIAGQHCDTMIIGDIEKLDLDAYLTPSSFDVIIFGDVLEHLVSPEDVLKKVKKYLRPDGYLAVSLPNVCHGDIILNLLMDNFGYTSMGLLDATHLRFFGLRNIIDLFSRCGYSITGLHTTVLPVGGTEQRLDPGVVPEDLANFVKSLPNSSVYQYIFKASPSPTPEAVEAVPVPDLDDLFRGAIEGSIQAEIKPLLEELSAYEVRTVSLAEQVEQLTEETQSLQVTISERDAQIASLDGQVEQLTGETQSLQVTISGRDGQIASLNEHTRQQATQLMQLSNELASMKQSVVWRLLMKYHSGFVERALPQNTCRRELYDLGLKGCRILVNEGIRGLCWHYKERKRVKKIESGLDFQTDNHIKEVIESALEIQDIRDIVFDRPAKNPDVSIIIPVYNNIDYTLKCLKSISLNTKGSFEVVMVDDASKDDVQDALKNIGNITVIRNENNVGFVESCNRGAKRCKGKYILFLNNDTIVTEDWLEPLIQAMELQGVGAAGAKLVYPAGRLQEAGGIIWNDASGWNYGRGDDPAKSEYNFVRDVDYCSGAALIVRRDLFEGLGGFDEQFKPGYYEDTDLCFSIRDLGYRVLYQPRSVVIHFEGLTSGTDINTGMKRYQEVNKKKFLRKWNEVLTKEHYKPDPMNLFPARIRRDGKKILVIDHYVPTFDRDSGSFRMYHLLKILVDLGHKVTFIGDNLARLEPYTTELQQSGVEILHQPYISSIEEYLVNKGNFFDIVILSRAHIAKKHIYSVRRYCSNAKIIFDTVDLQFLRESRRAEVEDNSNILVEAEKLKQLELQLARLSDVTLVVSPIEKEILRKEDPSLQVDVVSNIHKINKCLHSFSEREGIMFLGGFAHMPNVDGVKWFVEEIFPLIKENIPDLVFYIVGNEPPEDIKSLNSQDIIVTGYVEDLSPYFDNCRVFVSPLRYGAGVKGKINQSMSYGLPVVTTSVGAEGMALVDGKNALISDRPEEFADNVVELYRNEQLWSVLSRNSIKNVRENFSYDMAKETLREMIDNLRVKS